MLGCCNIPILREPDARPCRLRGDDDDAIDRFVARAAVASCRCRCDRVLRGSRGWRNRARFTGCGDHPASRCGRGDLRRYPGRSCLPCRSGVSRVPRPSARRRRHPGPLGPHGFDLQRPVQCQRPFLRSAQARQLRAYRSDDRDFPPVPNRTGLRQVRRGSPRQHHLRYRHSPAGARCRKFRVRKARPFLVPRAPAGRPGPAATAPGGSAAPAAPATPRNHHANKPGSNPQHALQAPPSQTIRFRQG
jgi:hypothetical protein